MFELRQCGDVKFYVPLTIENTKLVRVGFSTREGGVSEGCYRSMNLRWNCDDAHENVLENYKRITAAIGIDYRDTVLSKQVHEDKVLSVGCTDKGNGIIKENKFTSADALMTNEKGVALAATFADCTPVFFIDPIQKAAAVAHSGWRGTVKEISVRVIDRMHEVYCSKPENIICAIGPSIQEDHFEVGDDVAEIFIRKFGEDTVRLYGDRYHVSMQKAIKKQLISAGVKEENIDDSGICTYCNSDLLFSHRKTNGKRGNLGAFIQLI